MIHILPAYFHGIKTEQHLFQVLLQVFTIILFFVRSVTSAFTPLPNTTV